jgi:puromycin-sensitive aminopeptidase
VKFLNTPELVDDAASFFAEHPIEQASKTLDQILERQRVNAELRALQGAAFADALTG